MSILRCLGSIATSTSGRNKKTNVKTKPIEHTFLFKISSRFQLTLVSPPRVVPTLLQSLCWCEYDPLFQSVELSALGERQFQTILTTTNKKSSFQNRHFPLSGKKGNLVFISKAPSSLRFLSVLLHAFSPVHNPFATFQNCQEKKTKGWLSHSLKAGRQKKIITSDNNNNNKNIRLSFMENCLSVTNVWSLKYPAK